MRSIISNTCYLIMFTAVLFSCESIPNEYPNGFPVKWYMLSEGDNNKSVLQETEFGLRYVEMDRIDNELYRVFASSQGGVVDYMVNQVLKVENGYDLVIDNSTNDTLTFRWEDKDNGVGYFQIPYYGGSKYVTESSKDNFDLIAYTQVDEAEDLPSIDPSEFIYTGTSGSPMGYIFLDFQNRQSGDLIQVLPSDLEEGINYEDNQFYSFQEVDTEEEMIMAPKPDLHFQVFKITYHTEDRQHAETDEMFPFVVVDEFELQETRSPEEQNLRITFSKLPSDAFNGTTDGLSEGGIKALLTSGKTDEWTLFQKNDQIKITSNYGGSSVTIVNLPSSRPDLDPPLTIVYTVNEQSTDISFWMNDWGIYTPKLNEIPSEDILPEIENADFFDEEVATKPALTFGLDDDNAIIISPYTYMEPAFENIETKREVKLIWNGEGFEKSTVAM